MTHFDPYHKWLGIPPEDQPADYYRLLGLKCFESDPEVIEAAADQRMAFLQRCATGEHVAESQDLLNRVAAARVCLLTSAKKESYDRLIRAADSGGPPNTATRRNSSRTRSNSETPTKQQRGATPGATWNRRHIVLSAAFGGIIALFLIAILTFRLLRGSSPVDDEPATEGNSPITARGQKSRSSRKSAGTTRPVVQLPTKSEIRKTDTAKKAKPDAVKTPEQPVVRLRMPDLYPVESLIATSFRIVAPIATLVPGAPIGGERHQAVAEGRRVVAVRGVFPIRKQYRTYVRALQLQDDESETRKVVEIFGFQLERQVSADEGRTWGAWTVLNFERNKRRLAELAEFETDRLSPDVLHSQITSPLPKRLVRVWGDEVLHPRLRRYRLTSEKRQQKPNATKDVAEVILFRYLDFDVLPRLTYRYRVRLTLRNPLSEHRAEEVDQKSVKWITVEHVLTPSSDVTEPVTTPSDVEVFLNSVDRRPTLNLPEPTASVAVFQWFPKPGTTIRGQLKGLTVGQMVAGVDPQTRQLDPGRKQLRSRVPTEFRTYHTIIDMRDGRRMLETRHMQELGLKNYGKVPDVDEILIGDESGTLKVLDPITQSSRYDAVSFHLDAMMRAFKHWAIEPNLRGKSSKSTTQPAPKRRLRRRSAIRRGSGT